MPSSSVLAVFKKGWDGLQAGLMWFGDRISDVLFTILYFTVFAIVAIPYRLFVRVQAGASNYRQPEAAFQRTGFTEEW